MYSKVVAAVVAFVMLVPVASSAPAIWGTEEEPELADPPGNVEHSPLYTGQDERVHLDLLAGWFEYDAVNNTLNTNLKLSSLEGVNESTEEDWLVYYSFRGNVSYRGEHKGELNFLMVKNNQFETWSPSVSLNTPNAGVEVPFTFERDDGTPGYFRWYVPMDYLQNQGDQVATLAASAWEEQRVGDTFVSTGVMNRNPSARADGAFVWKDLEPTSLDATDDESLTPKSPDSTSTTSAESVAVGLAASASAVLVAFAWRRRSA